VLCFDERLSGRDLENGHVMAPNIAQYLDNTVLVSIPAIFSDGECRPYKLLGVELNGLWLQSDDLTRRLLPRDHKDLASFGPAAFVPFAHIAGVMIATSATPLPAQSGEASASARTASTNEAKPAPPAAPSRARRPRPKKSSSDE
jgi:hypothetical protein